MCSYDSEANVPISLAGWTSTEVDYSIDHAASDRNFLWLTPSPRITPEFQRGWDAALLAAWTEERTMRSIGCLPSGVS